MKRRTLVIVGGVIAALAASMLRFDADPIPIAVETATVERGLVAETVTNTRAGTIKACQRARLAPPFGRADRETAGQEGRSRARPGRCCSSCGTTM